MHAFISMLGWGSFLVSFSKIMGKKCGLGRSRTSLGLKAEPLHSAVEPWHYSILVHCTL